uniref:Uncharacterized protein n=1 Tax=Arundo donax TaxID=35708 RepID=A0A0A9DZN1_ARUDO
MLPLEDPLGSYRVRSIPMPLLRGQRSQEMQLTQRMSLPVSTCT